MTDMSYAALIKQHMAAYKKNMWPNMQEKGCFHGLHMPHILPAENGDENLLSPFRKEFLKYEGSKGLRKNRHMYFSHLNSSQAMCFNYFFPLWRLRKLDQLFQIFNIPAFNIDYENCSFEKESSVEYGDYRKTCFDYYIAGGEKVPVNIFIEVKYTENGFGTAKADSDHTDKFQKVYYPYIMQKQNVFSHAISQEEFFENYQILRNLINIDDNSYVVILCPKGNAPVVRQAQNAYDFLKKDYKKYFKIIFWEDLISQTKTDTLLLKEQLELFRRKYLV